MHGQTRHNTRPHAQFPTSFLDMDALTTSQRNKVLVRKLLCAWLIFDTLSVSVCTTTHWQTSGQLVQELNVCTVHVLLICILQTAYLLLLLLHNERHRVLPILLAGYFCTAHSFLDNHSSTPQFSMLFNMACDDNIVLHSAD